MRLPEVESVKLKQIPIRISIITLSLWINQISFCKPGSVKKKQDSTDQTFPYQTFLNVFEMSRLSPKRSTTPDKEDTESDHAYVKVYIRIRPLNKRELTDADIVIPWQYSQKQIRSTNTAHGASRSTTFDGVLGPETTQKMCYNNVASPLVVSCMK